LTNVRIYDTINMQGKGEMEMETKERAREIRRELKERGIRASVRCRHCGYSDAIDIRIKDLGADYEEVERIARSHESVRRCEYSHEILSGGNRYVSVSYDYDAKDAGRAHYTDLAVRLLNEWSARENVNHCITLAERGESVWLLVPANGGAHVDALVMKTRESGRAWTHAAYNHHSLAEALAIADARWNLGLVS
jgi:hypothetical protein